MGKSKNNKVENKVAKKTFLNQKNSLIAGVAMIVAALAISVGTYAYYQSTITGSVEGSITAWSFLVNEQPTTFTAELGDLKPGVSGEIELNLSAAASGLGVSAVVSFSNQLNWPANLKLYTDAAHNNEIVVGTTTITRTIAAAASDTVTVYYYWPYGTVETPIATTEDKTASVKITVVGTQVAP